MRLNKFLANSGVASRRKSEKIIEAGRVKINGKIITDLSTRVNKDDIVLVDDKEINLIEDNLYILLNKPIGFTSTVKDPHAKRTVLDLLQLNGRRLYPVGRLDKDSCGALLISDDGDFTYKLTHPKHDIFKTYFVIVEGITEDKDLKKLENGVVIDGYKTNKAVVEKLQTKDNKTELNITIGEGRNRQVRKMFQYIGHKVIYLKRISIGEVKLGDLPEGKFRNLTKEELEYFRNI